MAKFISALPRWEAEGIQPPENLLKDGWKASQRPPADYFNWFFSKTHFALKELQEKAALDSDLIAHERSKNNPHEVTATQVGLSNLINQKQATKVEFDTHNIDAIRHILQAEREKWNSKAEGIHTHSWADLLNVPVAGLTQKGIVQLLDSVVSTDTTMAATPNSVRQAFNKGVEGVNAGVDAKKIAEDHIATKNNPHGTTKAHVGLGNVLDYGVASTTEAQAGALSNRYMTPILVSEAIKVLQAVKSVNGRTGDVVVSKSDVLLGNVDNVKQATKVEFDAHATSKSNPHGVTAGQVGGYTKAEVDSKVSSAQANVQGNLTTHVNDKNNPHGTTKTHIGLPLVDNIKQASKVEFDGHVGNKSNPHRVTASQVGAYAKAEVDSIPNGMRWYGKDSKMISINIYDKDLLSITVGSHDWTYINDATNLPPGSPSSSGLVKRVQVNTLIASVYYRPFNSTITFENFKLNSTTWAGWREQETTFGSQTKVNVVQSSLTSHMNNTNNPHGVTTEQINYLGLYAKKIDDLPTTYPVGVSTTFVRSDEGWFSFGMVTTTRANKNSGGGTYQMYTPYSPQYGGTMFKYRFGIYQTEIWSTWYEAETTAGSQAKATAVQSNLNAHTNNKANPHGTTKAHVGLSVVDNIQQATKTEFNAHNSDGTRHTTAAERNSWNGKEDKGESFNLTTLITGWSGYGYRVGKVVTIHVSSPANPTTELLSNVLRVPAHLRPINDSTGVVGTSGNIKRIGMFKVQPDGNIHWFGSSENGGTYRGAFSYIIA